MNGDRSLERRYLIVGATGQVGTQMLRYLESTRGPQSVLPTARTPREGWLELDLAALSSPEQVSRLLDKHPLAGIFCVAGMTNVDGCELDPETAERTNARGPGLVARYASAHRLPFVYFSTEYLFDGSMEHPGPYTEEDTPRPLSAYGRSKLAGERAVLEACPEALVLRTTVVYGRDPRQLNYLYSLMRNLSGAGTPMRVPYDQISTPTYNVDLIQTAVGLLDSGAHGVFHVCGPELLGRMEFALIVARKLGLNEALLRPVSTAELGQRAARPLAAGLATAKLTSLYPELRLRPVQEAIQDCLSELEAFIYKQQAQSGSRREF